MGCQLMIGLSSVLDLHPHAIKRHFPLAVEGHRNFDGCRSSQLDAIDAPAIHGRRVGIELSRRGRAPLGRRFLVQALEEAEGQYDVVP